MNQSGPEYGIASQDCIVANVQNVTFVQQLPADRHDACNGNE
jgi:hypothetical protein